MDFEQDYIMRLIKQMVAALISVILGKENKMHELPLEDRYKASEGLLRELLTMVNDGKINEAENLLYERLEQDNRKDIENAILFYSYLNELDNDFLEKCNYSRAEIEMGVREIAKRSGVEGLVEIFCQIQ
ncbi:MAG: DUF6483 family protein [Lachnospiraceae bacterium]|nr:DUF6483 family protein [Lachnospiraceae bacterium]